MPLFTEEWKVFNSALRDNGASYTPRHRKESCYGGSLLRVTTAATPQQKAGYAGY